MIHRIICNLVALLPPTPPPSHLGPGSRTITTSETPADVQLSSQTYRFLVMNMLLRPASPAFPSPSPPSHAGVRSVRGTGAPACTPDSRLATLQHATLRCHRQSFAFSLGSCSNDQLISFPVGYGAVARVAFARPGGLITLHISLDASSRGPLLLAACGDSAAEVGGRRRAVVQVVP